MPPIKQIILDPPRLTLSKGEKRRVKATALYPNGTAARAAIAFGRHDPAVLAVTRVGTPSAGTVDVVALAAGETTLVAQATTAGVTGSAEVTVAAPVPPPVVPPPPPPPPPDPIVTPPPPPSGDGLIVIADPVLAFLLGPQTTPAADQAVPARAGSPASTPKAIARLSRAASVLPEAPHAGALARAALTPSAADFPTMSARLAGTVTLTHGSATVRGTDTRFLTDFVPRGGTLYLDIPASADPLAEGYVHATLWRAPVDDTTLTLPVPWAGPTLTTTYRREDAALSGDAMIGGVLYYSFPYALQQAARKTGDPVLQAHANRVTHMAWRLPAVQTARRYGNAWEEGFDNGTNFGLGARYACIDAFLIWAQDGCPLAAHGETPRAVQDYCAQRARAHYAQFLAARVAFENANPAADPAKPLGLDGDIRDGGYAVLWCVLLAKAHPDPAVRAEMLGKAIAAVRDYYLPNQEPDGLWLCLNPAWGNWKTRQPYWRAAQPFMLSLLCVPMGRLHELIAADAAHATLAAAIRASIQRSCDGWMGACYGGPPFHADTETYQGVVVRAAPYAVGDDAFGYQDGATGEWVPCPAVPGVANRRWTGPAAYVPGAVAAYGTLEAAIASIRFHNALPAATFYLAASLSTGEQRARYLGYGDELLDACWAWTDGDGHRSQWFTAYPKNKDWTEHTRHGWQGLGWRQTALNALAAGG